MTSHCVIARIFLTVICFLLAAAPARAEDNWRPIDPAHLAMKAPVVEQDADAEAIFWDVQVDFGLGKIASANYVRIKIFTERGKELRSKIELPYLSKNKIEDIAGRTIKADGTIVELKNEAIFDRTLVKLRGVKINAKTFAMPAVEPGVIIEYRWREVINDAADYFVRMIFQRDIPIQLSKYTLKTSFGSSLFFRSVAFNMKSPPMVPETDKRFSYSMTNVRAFHDEPHMPPANHARSWMLAYYVSSYDAIEGIYDHYTSRMKVNDDIKRAAQAAIGDASTPDQKLERLFDFCRQKIKNINDDLSGLTGDDLAKLKENKTAADTLKRGIGTGEDIDLLFAALATAAGFDARVARLADRSDTFFNPEGSDLRLVLYFMRSYNIAVRIGAEWRFFDPASTHVPFGMLRWQEEGIKAMILARFSPLFVETPVSPSQKSLQKRTANLRLTEDGALEGEVRIEYTGHSAVEKRGENVDESASQREEALRDMIKERMSTAEISNIKIENITDSGKPFVYAYHVLVPGYAQRTGKRLFLQPSFFQKGIGAMFPDSTRKLPVYFHYAWKEEDVITIKLPAGFALDNADAPAPLKARNVVDYKVWMAVNTKDGELHFKRTFDFNGLLFPPSTYALLKEVFDFVHGADNHTITLKPSAAVQ